MDGDYSAPRAQAPLYRPHDLVRIRPYALNDDVPCWAHAVVARGEPVVVRRGRRGPTRLPIGIRGASRDRRHAAHVSCRQVCGEPLTPESLIEASRPLRASRLPALACLPELRAAMTVWRGTWGIGGAVGYELACGVAACHAESDIDLILRAPARPARVELHELAERLVALPVRCDVQMETPAGGVALADWISGSSQVLIKSDHGPYLAADPWATVAG